MTTQVSNDIAVRALTIQAERQRVGMPISLIDAVDLAVSPPGPAGTNPIAIAAAATALMVERQRIGAPISYVDAVTEVFALANLPAQTAMAVGSTITMPLTRAATTDDAEVAVAMAIQTGKVPENCRGWAMSFATEDIKGFRAFSAGSPAVSYVKDGKRPDQIAADILEAAKDYQVNQAEQGLTVDIIDAVSAVQNKF